MRRMKTAWLMAMGFNLVMNTACFANLCDRLSGRWEGEWVSGSLALYSTTLTMTLGAAQHFSGEYVMSNGEQDDFEGDCTLLDTHQAFLQVPHATRVNNPCYGLLIENAQKVLLHLYCFNPNDAGFFTKIA